MWIGGAGKKLKKDNERYQLRSNKTCNPCPENHNPDTSTIPSVPLPIITLPMKLKQAKIKKKKKTKKRLTKKQMAAEAHAHYIIHHGTTTEARKFLRYKNNTKNISEATFAKIKQKINNEPSPQKSACEDTTSPTPNERTKKLRELRLLRRNRFKKKKSKSHPRQ